MAALATLVQAAPDLVAIPFRQDRSPLRMLIVEDNFTSRLLLQAFLSQYGDCHLAVNGKEAVEAFRLAYGNGSPYDLTCMDILMPEMDGKQAVRSVREIEEAHGVLSDQGAKIIMTTAVDDVKDVMESFGALCDAYLFKPIDTRVLLGHLKSFKLVD
jgi:two-component system chemotaxis response regulator CheY